MERRMADAKEVADIAVAEKVSRELIESASADAVVILWTNQRRRSTRIYRHQIGNNMLCDALVERALLEQVGESE
jgi:hypothetical protein